MSKNEINSSLVLEDHLFFLIEDGRILVWNYKLHEQYALEIKYFLELLGISKAKQYEDKEICKELINAGLVSETPKKSQVWGWDLLSKIFHVGTKNVGEKNVALDSEQFAQEYL